MILLIEWQITIVSISPFRNEGAQSLNLVGSFTFNAESSIKLP
jgi:hypothetical protein